MDQLCAARVVGFHLPKIVLMVSKRSYADSGAPTTVPARKHEPLNAVEYETRARALLPPSVFSYYVGGSGDETTLTANSADFRRLRFLPHVLVPVGNLSSRTTALAPALRHAPAEGLAFPALIAPMAMQRMCGEGGGRGGAGELAVARAADAVGTGMCLSTLATESIERVALGGGGVRLFQLYLYRDRSVSLELVARARKAGYSAVVLTVDSPLFGRRERDLRGTGLSLPSHLRLANFEDGVDHGDDEGSKESLRSGADAAGQSVLQRYGSDFIDPNLTWEDVRWLVQKAGLPVWVKGVVRPDDAARAVDAGVSCIIVSNHGGRQLDGAVTGIQALRGVAVAVGGRIPVVVDGGVRRGTDIAKALALGASAVLLGRPILWALAVDGEAGVERLLRLLKEEFRVAMALLGARSVHDITQEMLAGHDCDCARAKL